MWALEVLAYPGDLILEHDYIGLGSTRLVIPINKCVDYWEKKEYQINTIS